MRFEKRARGSARDSKRGRTIAFNGAGGRVGFEINASRAGPLMRVVRRSNSRTTIRSRVHSATS